MMSKGINFMCRKLLLNRSKYPNMVSVLFLLFKSPFEKNVTELIESFECKKAVVLLGDASYYEEYPENTDVFVLKDDAEARGITPKGKMINYDKVVELIEEYDRVVTL